MIPNPTTPILTAKQQISFWRSDQQQMQNELMANGNSNLVNLPVLSSKAFSFHLNDLQYLLHRINYTNNGSYGYLPRTVTAADAINGIRLYPANSVANGPGNTPYGRLMMVGIKGFNPEMDNGGNDLIPAQDIGVFDISHPCSNMLLPPYPPAPSLSSICPTQGISQMPGVLVAGPQYTLSLAEAQTRISGWQADQQLIKANVSLSSSPVLNTNSVAFHMDDLYQLIAAIDASNHFLPPPAPVIPEGGINAVRFYFGKAVDPNVPIAPYACLVAVGVRGFDPNMTNGGGIDVIELVQLPGTTSAPSNSGIYDFSYPCPSTCPTPGGSITDY